MGISEKRCKSYFIDNYFEHECSVNTSIREAFENIPEV